MLTLEDLKELLGADALQSFSDSEIEALLEAANSNNQRQIDELIDAAAIASLALLLLLPRPPGIRYVVPIQQYYRGRSPIPDARIQQIIDGQSIRTARATVRNARDLIAGRIDLPQYQEQMAREIMNGHLRLAQVGAGGRRQMRPEHYQQLHDQLYADSIGKGDLLRLQRHVERIRKGELSDAQIIDRARRYGSNTRQAYSNARHTALVMANQQWEAKRSLDPSSRHCEDCPILSTNGQWRPANEVVPVGSGCRCRGNCRCTVEYRRRQLIN